MSNKNSDELKLEFSHVVDDHSLYNFTHKFKKGPEFTFDHRKAIEEFYRLPKEQPLIQLHLDCFEKGLVYNEDKAAPTPKQPKVPMHLLYPGLRMPLGTLRFHNGNSNANGRWLILSYCACAITGNLHFNVLVWRDRRQNTRFQVLVKT